MLEILAVPALMAAVAFLPKGKGNDKRKIKTIFENVGYGIPKKGGETEFPRFKKRIPILEVLGDKKEEIGTRFIYTIPLGLPVTKITEKEKDMLIFSDGLNRPVITEYRTIFKGDPRKFLVISVFNKEIPTNYPYDKIPIYMEEDRDGNMIPKPAAWVMPLGKTLEEVIWVDFDKIPHMTIAGVTRFGKTVFLKVLMTYIIEHHAEDVEFYIIDLKGGLEFSQYEVLQQVKGVAGNYIQTFFMVIRLHNLMHFDLEYFKRKGIRNIVNSTIKRRRFIVVDEAAQLAAESFMSAKLKDIPEIEPYFDKLPEELKDKKLKDLMQYIQYLLSEIARLGGGLGYRLIYCTQYPTADTLPRQIKMNADSKVTFRLPTGYASEVAIDVKGAESLPSTVKGRALYKTHDLQQMQVPFLSDADMWKKLERYQVPRLWEGEYTDVFEHETNETGGNFKHLGQNQIRHTKTTPNNPPVRF